MMLLTTSMLKTLVRFERKTRDTAVMGAGNDAWVKVAEVYAQVQDLLPSRGESVVEGVSMAARPCRIRLRYRADIDSSQRIKIGERALDIISGPARIDGGRNMELIAQEASSRGGTA